MTSIELVLQILMALPPIHSGTPAAAVGPTPSGSGTLLISSCQPNEVVLIQPWNISGVANADGVVIVKAPAQREKDDPYFIRALSGSLPFNGTLNANESLSASCP